MSDKMQVLFVKQTSHVLAAFTRAANPEDKPAVSALAGSGLLVRNPSVIAPTTSGGERLTVPAEALDVAVIDYNPGVFVSPHNFEVGGGEANSVGATAVTLSASDLKTDRIIIKYPTGTAAPEDTKVWVQLEQATPAPGDAPERRLMEGAIEKTKFDVQLSLTIRPGASPASIPLIPFFVLVLVAGFQPLFTKLTPT